MNRVSKVILITLGALLLSALGLVIAVNLYVQAPGTQKRIQDEISRALRVPIDITNASVTPWGGLKIAGITVPNGEAKFLEASAFSARYKILPLLKGEMIVTTMILDNPKIQWAQNEEGRWVLPALPDTGEKKRAKDNAAEQGETAPKKTKSEGLKVRVESLEIRNGQIELRDTKGERVAAAADVQITYKFPKSDRAEGTVEIGRLAWHDSLVFNEVRSPFIYVKGELSLPTLEATAGGGAVTGKVTMEPEKKDSPFDFTLTFEKVDLAKLSLDAGWPAGQASGMLDGRISLHGSAKQAERAEGKGQVTLTDGQFRQSEFLQTLGQVLQIAELANLRVKDGQSQFRIADEKAFVEKFELQGTEIRLKANGLVRFDGKLALDAELGLSPRLAKQLPSFIRDNLSPAADDGVRSIPFKVSGKTDKPKTDLLDQLVGQKIGSQFDDLVTNLFGLKKKKDDNKEKEPKKKKKKDDQPKTEAPAESPAESEAGTAASPRPSPPAAPVAPAAPTPESQGTRQ